jgi:hypothetical protein
MIEIDWFFIAFILFFFFAGLSYLVYFRVTRKLFPQEMEFHKEINQNDATPVLSIEGTGIVKKIQLQITENGNSQIDTIIDGTNYSTFAITKERNKMGKGNFNEQKDELIELETNLDAKFHKHFSLFVHNRNDNLINSTGKVFYEIKKPLKEVLKAIYSETFS